MPLLRIFFYFGAKIVVFDALESYFNVAASKGAESTSWGQKIQKQGAAKLAGNVQPFNAPSTRILRLWTLISHTAEERPAKSFSEVWFQVEL